MLIAFTNGLNRAVRAANFRVPHEYCGSLVVLDGVDDPGCKIETNGDQRLNGDRVYTIWAH